MRTVKQSFRTTQDVSDEGGSVPTERIHLYVQAGEYERVGVVANRDDDRYDGDVTLGTESEYHVAGAKLVHKPGTDATTLDRERRMTLPLADLLGTATGVVDVESGELLEFATFHPNGGREKHGTTETASLARERNAFTGNEKDEEVGVTYFGERYLVQRVGRWEAGGDSFNSRWIASFAPLRRVGS